MEILLPIVSLTGALFQISSLILSFVLKAQIGELSLDINRTGLFRTYSIFSSQIPDLQVFKQSKKGLSFALATFLAAFRWFEYKRNQSSFGSGLDSEQKYLAKLKILSSLEWGNIAITQSFIFFTIVLSDATTILFANRGLKAAEYTYDKYINYPDINDHDYSTLTDLEKSFGMYNGLIACNSICIAAVVIQFALVVIRKLRM